MLDECLITAVVVETDGPALRCRNTRHAMEFVVLISTGVRRGNNCPGGSVPMLDHCLVDASTGRRIGVADGPAVRHRSAGHARKEGATARVGRSEYRPASSSGWRSRLGCEAEHREQGTNRPKSQSGEGARRVIPAHNKLRIEAARETGRISVAKKNGVRSNIQHFLLEAALSR